jgi:UMF1 family MFS transporter
MTRYAAILGPLIVAGLSLWTGSSRYGILGIMALFVIGLLLFIKVKEPDGNSADAPSGTDAGEV